MKKSNALELILALALEQMDDMKELAKNDASCEHTYMQNVVEMKEAKPLIEKMIKELEKTETPLNIGDKVYGVHNKYVQGSDKTGAKIISLKVVTFANSGGKIVPVLRAQGSKYDTDKANYALARSIDEAKELLS